MLQVGSYLLAHIAVVVEIIALAVALGTLCHYVAVFCGSMKWNRAAHGFDFAATVLLNGAKLAPQAIGMITGRPFEVPGGTPAASPQTALPPNSSQR